MPGPLDTFRLWSDPGCGWFALVSDTLISTTVSRIWPLGAPETLLAWPPGQPDDLPGV